MTSEGDVGPHRRRDAGVGLLETIVALLLGLLVATLSIRALAHARTAAAGLALRSEALATERVARVLLRRETAWSLGPRDWRAFPPDSIALRAFRAVALVCARDEGGGQLQVSWQGLRAPSPEKDSLLLLGADGGWRVHALVARAPAAPACAHGGAPERWRIDPPDSGAVLARVFERGSYHLSGSALRYRRGAGGRQPLTPETLATPPSAFVRDPARTYAELWTAGASAPSLRVVLMRGGPDGGAP